ncbi:MAG TPA: 1-deoxy-D-xylulose-5-phosphate reductoisomerase [Caulobacterales bacterium]|nr:1-deoxy-D-xylulose-5-phosphate reductoisomerase [Caulobacterales bacterium]
MSARFHRRVSILGATGSIGRSTARVIEELRVSGEAEIEIEALTAGRDVAGIAELARTLKPRFVAFSDETKLGEARAALAGAGVLVGAGAAALQEAAQRDADWVMSAIVGAAAIRPTLAAIERGATVALANKESLVCAGQIMKAAAARAGARLLPVDSEHNGAFQVLGDGRGVERITLTGSGGPFRGWTPQAMAAATPEQARRHPNFSMGAKISVDSATLMNKGLELIEASCLFDLGPDRLDLVIHPQQAVHALVSYCDGSMLAHLGPTDMRVAIVHALAWPDRAPLAVKRLDLTDLGQLTFEMPDRERFPALDLARRAMVAGGAAPTMLNAANEIAVAAFLERRIGFLDIASIVEAVLNRFEAGSRSANSPSSLDEVLATDALGRLWAGQETQRRQAA